MIINYDVNNKGGGGASAEGCVRYDQEQTLTDEQQQQAKDNLGIEDPEPQELLVETTYAELKALRNAGNLVPGTQYRITDYVATTVQGESQSANHPFDIIVTALDESTLSEEARAMLHDGDTYFANCNLGAWKLEYCLDNDTTRFSWADTVNGKGVIYHMIDEWNNDLHYDFKGIQFKRYKITACPKSTSLVDTYLGIKSKNGMTVDNEDSVWCYPFSDSTNYTDLTVAGSSCYNNKRGIYVYNNKMKLDNSCVIGTIAYGTVCGDNCSSWTCGEECVSWTCGNNCHSWTCGNNCSDWTCGTGCTYWTCGDSCYGWTCGNQCGYWTCGYCCSQWSCGNSSYGWTCGNSSYGWICGNGCYYWTCDSNCTCWTCGDNCSNWTCGDNCSQWSCGNSSYGWTFGDYHSYFTLEDGVMHIQDTRNGTSAAPYKNFRVLAGTVGTSSQKITITPAANAEYAQFIGNDSNGTLRTWVPADETGGGEAVQSDWNETDTDDPAFIKNKPEIPEPQAAVLYTPQTLTDAQKTQALSNIGAAPFIAEAVTIPQLTKSQVEGLYEAFTAGRPTFVKAKVSQTAVEPVLLQVLNAEHLTIGSGSTQIYYIQVFYKKESYSINLTGSTVTMGTNAFLVDANDSNMYVRKKGSWIRLPDIPQPENHQLLKSALSEPMGCSANTWATLAELNVPEDGAYQVSASARMLPADQSTAFKTATVSIELGTDAAGYTEVMEMTLPRSGEYGTLSVPVNATAGQKLRLRAISEANFYAQASPSAGKASATFIAAVRVGAIYQD